jgi:selenobiotic family peptide radical SAM maturase
VIHTRGHTYRNIFSNCHRILGSQTWGRILETLDDESNPQDFPQKLDGLKSILPLPEFLSDIARIEWALFQFTSDPAVSIQKIDAICVNPNLRLVPVGWKHLDAFFTAEPHEGLAVEPCIGTHVMIWRHPKTGKPHVREADDTDLLSLKITVEKTDPKAAATAGNVPIGVIDRAIRRSISQGILLSPPSRIQRDPSSAQPPVSGMESFLSADTFTLQWHITQACDLHCKHCYDRSQRPVLPFDTAVAVLDDLYNFCQKMHVAGHVSFTGGNPLLYPRFVNIYREASHRGFGTAILGNPTPIEEIETLLDIAKPSYFQISLEGLEPHNDHIRGKGHFQRSLAFLDQLRSLHIYTMVMLTLSKDNIHEVLPLAEVLQDRADFFTFNRLSTVGEGAKLQMADPETFQFFLRQYHAASKHNPVLGLKDNLINIVRHEEGRKPFGGCTGYGCGAAFNFVALLADGEVHACRKFPSLIGNIREHRLMDIYHSKLAEQYRAGGAKCSDCGFNIVCRGCLAITHSHGLDIFKEKDPYCFLQPETSLPG